MSWAGAVMSWAGAVEAVRIPKVKWDRPTDRPTDRCNDVTRDKNDWYKNLY